MDWTVMQWLEAGGYVVAIGGGVVGAYTFIAKKLRRFAAFKYPKQGEVGPNLLSADVRTVVMGHHVSMSAVVPDEAELMVIVAGDPESPKPDERLSIPLAASIGGAWFYSVAPAPLNWRSNRYRPATPQIGPSQTFTARPGPAELEIWFEKVGAVYLSVYERGSSVPTWTKEVQVLPVDG